MNPAPSKRPIGETPAANGGQDPASDPSATPASDGFLANHLLIGTTALNGDFFEHAVIYLCEHSEKGAMGLVINQLSPYSLLDLMAQLEMPEPEDPGVPVMIPVFRGGPVEPGHGFVLHDADFEHEGSQPLNEQFSLGFSQEILALLAHNDGPGRALVALGYAGWGPGQLERELAGNTWLVAPAEPDLVFDRDPGERWNHAAHSIGVEMDLLGPGAGHA